jgi:uncharacterized protein YdhG (YjbR/CyaY superfamily)
VNKGAGWYAQRVCGIGLAQGRAARGYSGGFRHAPDGVLARESAGRNNGAVPAQEIDQYLDALEEPKRATLALLRQTILDVIPEAEQGISYGAPAFRVRGKTIAGFAAFKNHLSYLPHSGSVFPQLKDELRGYSTSSGALRFDIGHALPAPLVEKLIAVRLQQAFPD